MSTTDPLHLAVALDGAGWHPAAWREESARTEELFTADYWLGLVRRAEEGALDFVTIEDSHGLAPGGAGNVRGHLDALLIAARVAPLTSRIGLVPTVLTTTTEPFHVSTQLATLDYISTGRAGWRARVAVDPDVVAAALAAANGDPDAIDPELISGLFEDAADHIEVVRRLWDSWEDDAVIRDAATGRFVDRDKLHYIDFAGKHFSVKGPSITPRPPQGQPVVTALAHSRVPYEFAAAGADVVFVTPADAGHARAIVDEVRSLTDRRLLVFADVNVFLDPARKQRLDSAGSGQYSSDAFVFAGSAAELADLLLRWRAAGLDGFRLRPGALPADLDAIVDELVPILRERGVFRTGYTETTLRGHLGLARPANRYARTEEIAA
ncbi:LLM class flavin-dependent oxidoreductase [Dactylosporangium vinaceum]|uniref:LLM class flavin-dependent oxidoreductase n=1 Tax=Dactylosporangium vinaceum TaxID=53362 RepID=A0ABV5M7V9_9ACTN|nr:LLM class flavin-dependent oxidoreductase [Dactylosporangium vinaceum]UAB92282.1 LLM class flavin-dependent oxidoreductase [Dactylosporangium vinaceum]